MGDEDDEASVEIALFYTEVPRQKDDPPSVSKRAEVLYGEGRLLDQSSKVPPRSSGLEKGLRVLRATNAFRAVAEWLSQPFFDYSTPKGEIHRFTFGWTRRPPVVGLPHPRTSRITSPVSALEHIHQFVRIEKAELLERMRTRTERGKERAQTEAIFAQLRDVAGVDLAEDSHWLGDVIVGRRNSPPASWMPISSEDRKSCRAFEVAPRSTLVGAIDVNVRACGTDGMCIFDGLLHWEDDDREPRRVELDEELASVSLRAWRAGRLVWEEERAVLRGFHNVVQIVGSDVYLMDRLSQQLAGVRDADPAKPISRARRVQRSSGDVESQMGMRKEPWSGMAVLGRSLRPHLPLGRESGYFQVGPAERARAAQYFESLFRFAESIVLVDPYFGDYAVEWFLTRVTTNAPFTIITNLPTSTHESDVQKLVDALNAARRINLPRNLEVKCAPNPRPGDQAFHDRYLLVRRHGVWDGWVLTNSFSGLAAQHPMLVVAAPQGLLDRELERLLATNQLDAIWPRSNDNAPASSGNVHLECRGWRAILNAVCPRGTDSEHEWLQRAQVQGFLSMNGTEPKWIMEPEAREQLLVALFGQIGSGETEGARVGLRPITLVRTIFALGEMSARALQLDAADVARRLESPRHGRWLTYALHCSFPDDPDPTLLREGNTHERLMVRQALQPDRDLLDAARFGVSLWNTGLWDLHRDRKSWDRCYAYAVLAYLDPQRAVALAEKVLDADFVLALAGNLDHRIYTMPRELCSALAASSSPLLRTLGAEGIAIGPFDGHHGGARHPESFAVAVADMKSIGIPEVERALHLALWGVLGGAISEERALELASALVEELDGLGPAEVAVVIESLFVEETLARPFFAPFVRALEADGRPFTNSVLETLVTRFSLRFRKRRERRAFFSPGMEGEITAPLAHAVRVLATRQNVHPPTLVRAFTELDSLRRETEPLTAFRNRAHSADVELLVGWTSYWESLAIQTELGQKPSAAFPVDTVTLAGEYLALGHRPGDKELRSALDDSLARLVRPSVFGDADLMVFVDEWKGKNAVDGPILAVEGRVFRKTDPKIGRLTALLVAAGAADWHASGRRSDHHFLFNQKSYSALVGCLAEMTSQQFTMPVRTQAFNDPSILDAWQQNVLTNPVLRDVWNTTSPFARALYRFADFTFRLLESELPARSKVVIVVDRQEWLDPRARGITEAVPGILRLGAGEDAIRGELWVVNDRTQSGARTLLPFLGLVDSELWAVERLMSLTLDDGSTVHDRLAVWRNRGFPDEPILDERELRTLLDKHAQHPNLLDYWQRAVDGTAAGRRVMIRDRKEK